MTEFMFLFRGGDSRDLDLSPEMMQAHMQKWRVWMGELAETGNFVTGLPLEHAGKVVSNSGDVVTDGPFAEGAEIVGGYLIVKANDLDHATELSKACPIFERGGTVEVRKLASMDI